MVRLAAAAVFAVAVGLPAARAVGLPAVGAVGLRAARLRRRMTYSS